MARLGAMTFLFLTILFTWVYFLEWHTSYGDLVDSSRYPTEIAYYIPEGTRHAVFAGLVAFCWLLVALSFILPACLKRGAPGICPGCGQPFHRAAARICTQCRYHERARGVR